jgi:RimJ/RimL family protein N-acetyltransferase
MQVKLKRCEVRSWREDDADSLRFHADNWKVWINLRDAFPHPYTLADARAFIRSVIKEEPETQFAIAVRDKAIGGIGFKLGGDVERVSAEIGYWLGETHWGKGIATEAVQAVTEHAIREHGLTRMYAVPVEWNRASFKVLEKAGYVFECRMRRSAVKDGKVVDQFLYAYVAPE